MNRELLEEFVSRFATLWYDESMTNRELSEELYSFASWAEDNGVLNEDSVR